MRQNKSKLKQHYDIQFSQQPFQLPWRKGILLTRWHTIDINQGIV